MSSYISILEDELFSRIQHNNEWFVVSGGRFPTFIIYFSPTLNLLSKVDQLVCFLLSLLKEGNSNIVFKNETCCLAILAKNIELNQAMRFTEMFCINSVIFCNFIQASLTRSCFS